MCSSKLFDAKVIATLPCCNLYAFSTLLVSPADPKPSLAYTPKNVYAWVLMCTYSAGPVPFAAELYR